MSESLESLFQAISYARDQQDLRSRVIVRVGKYLGAKRWGIFFFDEIPPCDKWTFHILELALSIELL
jgi:hypothetical protein